jgi:hypothetical protein
MTPDLVGLPPDELLGYHKLIAAAIDATDRLIMRTLMIDTMGQAIIDGATEENQRMAAVGKRFNDNPWEDLDTK